MPTRIYHRFDSKSDWDAASASGGGKLLKGELGIAWYVQGSNTVYEGYVGNSTTATEYDACPLLFRALVPNVQQPGVDADEYGPLLVKTEQSIPTGSTVAWDATDGVWKVNDTVLNLAAYPTADGVVVWDQSLGQFVVGASVDAVELDGGTY